MRGAFVRALADLAEQDPRIMLLTADLGYQALEPMMERCPKQFMNMGVSEQNMLGVATGLADAGFIPYVYSIVPFATLRPYEFIRNGPILHHLPVRVVGVGGGFDYGLNGLSHYGLEDVAVMRVQPGMTVIAPADARQTDAAVRATAMLPGPLYLRLGKDDRIIMPGLDGRFALGRSERVRAGRDALLLSMGAAGAETMAAADLLAAAGTEVEVRVVSTLNPSPSDDLVAAMSDHTMVVTVEVHYVNGGLGSLVAEVIAEHGLPVRLVRCGVRHTPDHDTGTREHMQRAHGLSPELIAATAARALQR